MRQRLRGTYEGDLAVPPMMAANHPGRQVVLVSLTKDEARRIYESNRLCAERALSEGALEYAEQLWLINLKLLKQFEVKELALACCGRLSVGPRKMTGRKSGWMPFRTSFR